MLNLNNNAEQIRLYVDEKEQITDVQDQCMKASVGSFEIFNNLDTPGNYLGGPQVVLHLKDFTADIKFVTKNDAEVDRKEDKEIICVLLAAESVLKHLNQAQCVGKDSLTFQARRGKLSDSDYLISGLFGICFTESDSYSLNFKQGIISHSYAYLSERRLCLFLNQSHPEILKRIEDVLVKFFPKKHVANNFFI